MQHIVTHGGKNPPPLRGAMGNCTGSHCSIDLFMIGQGWNADVPGEPYGGICVFVIGEEPFNKTGGIELLFPRLPLRSFLGRSSAALHLDSTCRQLLDAVASLFIVARLTITSAAFPLAEELVYVLGRTIGTCIAYRLPWRSFLGRSC